MKPRNPSFLESPKYQKLFCYLYNIIETRLAPSLPFRFSFFIFHSPLQYHPGLLRRTRQQRLVSFFSSLRDFDLSTSLCLVTSKCHWRLEDFLVGSRIPNHCPLKTRWTASITKSLLNGEFWRLSGVHYISHSFHLPNCPSDTMSPPYTNKQLEYFMMLGQLRSIFN